MAGTEPERAMTFELVSDFFRLDARAVSGFVCDGARPERRFTVELLVDGLHIGAALADHASARAKKLGLGDGCCGFTFVLSEGLFAQAKMVEARLANVGSAVGAPLLFNGSAPAQAVAPSPHGFVEWSGGLRFTGWADAGDGAPPEIAVLIDGERVATAHAENWRHVDRPRPQAQFGFDITLPEHLADGRVWTASFLVGRGVELEGSPVTFVAPPGGLEATLAALDAPPGQRLTAHYFDRLMPGSLPFSRYGGARENFQPAAPAPSETPLGVLAFDGDGVEATLTSLETQTHLRWAGGVLPRAESALTFAPEDLADFLRDHADGIGWFLFLAPGVVLNADALARFACATDAHPDASLIYADYEISGWPVALPACDCERMLEQAYFAPCFLIPRATVERAVTSAENLFRLANLAFDQAGAGATAVHLPGPAMRMEGRLDDSGLLAQATSSHLRARRIEAAVEPAPGAAAPRCRVHRRGGGKVSILIPTRNRHELLRNCIDSIFPATTKARAEIIVIDNESSDPQTLRYLQQVEQQGVAVVRAPGPFNYSHINNLAAAKAQGDILCFLNNDVVAQDAHWLEEMVSRLADETTGVVGAKLLWPSGVVQHGGVTLGVNFGCAHDFRDRIDRDPGYFGALEVARETCAVTAACMLTRKNLFLELGGFDALRFPINFNDVDYCLRVREMGLRVVFTPHAVLTHHESASRGKVDDTGRFRRELWMLRHKWGEALATDPFYSPLLALSDPSYSALAWPPRSLAPRRNQIQPGVQPPPGY
ncbi:GT2 family glycosyltransferase [Rhodoblastus acidophilus]|nr:GT2 family glycosyltransferase [Rhodoblastus acidophilus]